LSKVSLEKSGRQRRWRALLAPAIKVAVSVALLVVLFSRVDVSRLWGVARSASAVWLAAAVGLYFLMIFASAWRWGLLLEAQNIRLPLRRLTSSFLVATFFNNFLPSNIGGDVLRVADTAPAAGSKTLATTVVLIDRAIGLLGLVLVAALGATAASRMAASGGPAGPIILWTGFAVAMLVAVPILLAPHAVARALQPLRKFHPQWVDERLGRLTAALLRFREAPAAIGGCFAGAIFVQGVLVAFYLAVAHSMRIPVSFAELAVVVPISFIAQMLPVSMNGFGVREATFGFYFTRLGLPLESALLVSFVGAALIMLVSLSGAAAYVGRGRHSAELDPRRV
jgi:uncharacterized protein (TIRG00374 family)